MKDVNLKPPLSRMLVLFSNVSNSLLELIISTRDRVSPSFLGPMKTMVKAKLAQILHEDGTRAVRFSGTLTEGGSPPPRTVG